MARYKVILSYDGTAFSGMQRQANARSVQGEVEDALRKLGWGNGSILAAGRTDAGVHASGQVIAFDLEWSHSEEDLRNALNAALPEDVAAQGVERAEAKFHPRYDAQARRYRYRIFCRPVRDPLRERYAWRVWPAVEMEAMQTAADQLLGEHDFATFGSPPKADGPTVRRVFQAQWRETGEGGYEFEITANAFLYHMVRRVVGLLVKIGQGQAEADAVARALDDPAHMLRELAPPEGLCLVNVDYTQQ